MCDLLLSSLMTVVVGEDHLLFDGKIGSRSMTVTRSRLRTTIVHWTIHQI